MNQNPLPRCTTAVRFLPLEDWPHGWQSGPTDHQVLKVARLLPARNASRSDAQAGEDGLFGFLRQR
ncbi:MAG TPA: hypothetical protein DCZ95_07925 [Verrucomicrobia bacterium]|nr:MAG: hypothetical protein A2X46_14765 [Lentisphaerae bacterium GWF2_57_35]HBA84004.1 hypothetical protein [Verrucomicrobiota bacterium]